MTTMLQAARAEYESHDWRNAVGPTSCKACGLTNKDFDVVPGMCPGSPKVTTTEQERNLALRNASDAPAHVGPLIEDQDPATCGEDTMTSYRVRFEIDVDADSPREAAKDVWRNTMGRFWPPDPDDACVFDVCETDVADAFQSDARDAPMDTIDLADDLESDPDRETPVGESPAPEDPRIGWDLGAIAEMQTAEEAGVRDDEDYTAAGDLDGIIMGARQALAGQVQPPRPEPVNARLLAALKHMVREWVEIIGSEEENSTPANTLEKARAAIAEAERAGPVEPIAVNLPFERVPMSAHDLGLSGLLGEAKDVLNDLAPVWQRARSVRDCLSDAVNDAPEPITITLEINRGLIEDPKGLPLGVNLHVHDLDPNFEDTEPCDLHPDENCCVHEFTGGE